MAGLSVSQSCFLSADNGDGNKIRFEKTIFKIVNPAAALRRLISVNKKKK